MYDPDPWTEPPGSAAALTYLLLAAVTIAPGSSGLGSHRLGSAVLGGASSVVPKAPRLHRGDPPAVMGLPHSGKVLFAASLSFCSRFGYFPVLEPEARLLLAVLPARGAW